MGKRYWLVSGGLALSFAILLAVILNLMVIRHKYYLELARDNKSQKKSIPALRGKIVDRKGRVVAESVYDYFKMENGAKIYQESGEFKGYRFEGNDLAYDLKRHYNYGPSMGLLSGYVGKPKEEELAAPHCGQKIGGDELVGRSGAEEAWDCQLRGVDGQRIIEIDARGRYVRELGREEPVAGEEVVLSIDAFWQDKIYKMFNGRKGVAIISDPKTGKIITMVSSPAYDPNAFSYYQDNKQIKEFLEDREGMPFLNRAIGAKYHPGSVFKPVLATGALEMGVIDTNTLIEDTGVIKVGDQYSYSNWLWTKRGMTDGMVDVVKGLKRSNDIFFYRLGERMGLERIVLWAKKFGYGQKTGIELPGELEGLVPDEKWKMEARGEKWFLGNTYHLSIGQGDLAVTPLQVNMMTNIVASGGKKCRASLLKNTPPECQDLQIKPWVLATVTMGMKAACKSGGTAWPLFNFKTSIACKTGTAEVGDGSKETHAWLTAFAPADNPQISITVMVERGGEGSDVAAPIVGDILKEWFEEPKTVVPRY